LGIGSVSIRDFAAENNRRIWPSDKMSTVLT